jgi:prevent-host-death family protein
VSEIRVGVRDLKNRLSQYLRQVKAGQTVTITERGQPVGKIIPVTQSLEEKLEAMVQAGLLQWSGKKLEPMEPVAAVRGDRTVADLLIEDRE